MKRELAKRNLLIYNILWPQVSDTVSGGQCQTVNSYRKYIKEDTMQHLTFDVTCEGSAPGARLETYIQNYSEALQTTERPLILVLPGGGYTHLSPREGEPMAFQYCAMGYHAAVLYYSLAPEATYPAQIYEVAKAVALIRSHAQEWHVDPDRIIIQGCSAGAHLAALYGCIWKQDFIAEKIGLKSEDRDILKPNGQILCYPVITSGGFAHRGSFDSLCGGDEALEKELSVENLVNADTPKTFICIRRQIMLCLWKIPC